MLPATLAAAEELELVKFDENSMRQAVKAWAAAPLSNFSTAGSLKATPASNRDMSSEGCTLLAARTRPETDLYLDRAKPSYVGAWLEMTNDRLYPFFGALTEGLRIFSISLKSVVPIARGFVPISIALPLSNNSFTTRSCTD